MKQIPQKVSLYLDGKPDDFTARATLPFDDERRYPSHSLELALGRMFEDSEYSGEWVTEYGQSCASKGESDRANGRFVALGQALDNAIDDPDDEDEDDDPDEDEEEDNEDEDDDPEDDDENGRDWDLVAWSTFALEIIQERQGVLVVIGCLVRYENEDPPTMVYIPGVTIADLRRPRIGK